MKRQLFFTAFILSFLTLIISPLNAQSLLDGLSPDDSISPSTVHRIMGEAKTRQLASFRAAMAAQPEALFSQTQFDVGYYKIELKVDVPSKLLYGTVKMEARSLGDGLDTVQLDFDAIMTIDSVYIGSTLLSFAQSGYAATIQLDRIYNQNEIFSFSICYHGRPATGGFQGFSFATRNSLPVVSSLSEPYLARTWWPCKDRPDDKADSLDIFVTCDTALYCASNGSLIDTTRHDDGTWTFNYQVRYPITTYLFSVAISKYTVWKDWYYYGTGDSMVIVNHVYPDQSAYSYSHWNITPYAIGVYSNLFGQYPFINEKYGHANFEWGGGMEHQTVTSMTGTWFGFYEPVVVHELSHQWWGDMITCNNWHEIWLNEGFASYCEALYYEVKSGTASYHSYMSGLRFTGGGTIYITDTTNVDIIFGSIVYDKAAWVLHMLRHIVGDVTFFNILQTYYNSVYKFKDATTDQFKEICETESGMDLDYFFNEWIYGTYYPNYGWSYLNELDPSDGSYWTYIYVMQRQNTAPEVFSMPIDFRVTSPSGDTATTVVFNDSRAAVYILKNAEEPSDIALDPDIWILRDTATADKMTWTYHLLPLPIDSGTQYSSYLDSFIAKGGSGSNIYTITSGTLPSGLSLDTVSGMLSGIPYDYGDYSLTIKARDNLGTYSESRDFQLHIAPVAGVAGDVNNDVNVDLLDILFLISFKYKSGPPPTVPALADANKTCDIDLLDILYLISYKYKSGPPPVIGCVPL